MTNQNMKYIDKDYSNRQIHLGLVASCKKNDRYGLLYGIRKPPYDGKEQIYENKLFFFEKDAELEIAQNTLVSYLSYDYNGFTPQVEYVYPVSSLVVHKDARGTRRADDVYHDDETWRLINEGIPYFDYEPSRNYCIYYPMINDNECTIWRGLFGCGIYMRKEAVIYEMYKELNSLEHTEWPTLEQTTNAIIGFKEQINSFNASEIIDTFQIMKICRYVSRPGRDDHYFEDVYQTLPDGDKFLSYLLPTKQENVFFDDNAYRSDGYKDEVILLNEETTQAREKAKAEYSKEKHLAFLISDYFSNAMKEKDRADMLKSRISEEFDIENASEITSRFKGKMTDEFVTIINEYNSSTVVGPLEFKNEEEDELDDDILDLFKDFLIDDDEQSEGN